MTGSNSELSKLTPLTLAGHPNKDVRLQAANDLNAQKEPPLPVLVLLQSDVDPKVRIAATPRPRFEREREIELAFISDDADPTVREFLARCVRDQHLLSKLAREADPALRASVALRCHAPELFTSLARDQSEDVRYAVAGNSDCPTVLLSELRRDRSERVSKRAKFALKFRKRDIRNRLDGQYDYSDWARWSSAAQNLLKCEPGDGEHLLRSLAHESAKLGLDRVLRQRWIPGDVLREIAGARGQYYEVLHAIAANPATPPDVLSELSYKGAYSSPHLNDACDTACAALRNPHTPPRTLEIFASGYVYYDRGYVCTQELEAAWSNPSIPESLILSKPAVQAAKGGIASNRSAPSFVLAKLAQDDSLHIRCEVARNSSTPPEVLLSLSESSLKDLSNGLARPLAENPSSPREVFVALLQHPELRAWLAHSRQTPSDILVQLASDNEPRTRLMAAVNPSTPEGAVELLKEDQDVNQLAYLNNVGWARASRLEETNEREIEGMPLSCPTTSAEAASALIGSLSVSDRSSLAINAGPFFTVESEFLLTTLAEDPQPGVRRSVAANRHCPEATLRRLARDADDDVRGTVAFATANSEIASLLVDDTAASRNLSRNLATPARALMRLLDGSPELAPEVAVHPNTTSAILRKIASTTDALRRSVARHPKADAETLLLIAGDADPLVRQLVAAHRNTAAELLSRLGGDSDHLVRTIVAMNRRTPASTLERLAGDDDAIVRQVVAFQTKLALDVWATLAGDIDAGVRAAARETLPSSTEARRQVGGNPSTNAELLIVLGSDNDASVRQAVALNPSCPHSVLTSLSSDTNELVRASITRRPDAPAEALEQLAGDQKWAIRRAAKSALRQRR